MYWMVENYKDVLNIRKLCKRSIECEKVMQKMYWFWENYVRNIVNLRALCKKCTEYEKSM